jgi:DNA-binding NarL/FixJ family response regulator
MALYNLVTLVWVLRFQPTGPFGRTSAVERYGISPRESEIIDLLCAGCTNQEIANRLFISPATVKDHVYNIFRKTGVRNRVELTNLMRVTRPSSDIPGIAGSPED